MRQTNTLFTVGEYLALEAASETKHESWDGEIVAMAGVSLEHASRVSGLILELGTRIRGRCRVYASDLRVRTSKTKYAYPDRIVVCGDPDVTEERPPSLLNPTTVIEILSDSTEQYDRGRKIEAYTATKALKEYWIVQPEAPKIVRFILQEGEWVLRIEGGTEMVIRSEHLDIEVQLVEIYR